MRTRKCPVCGGTGQLEVASYEPQRKWKRCDSCGGRGVLPDPWWARLRRWLRDRLQ